MSQDVARATSLVRVFCTQAEQRSMVLNAAIAVLSMLVYVLDTLRLTEVADGRSSYVGSSLFFAVTGATLTADYVAVAIKKGWRLSFLLSPLPLCDLASSFPVAIISALILLQEHDEELLGSCNSLCEKRRMNAVHVLVVLRLFKLLRVNTMIKSEDLRKIYYFVVQLSSLVMVFSAVIASLENRSFPAAFYFSIVSVTTVGFGDVPILRTISRLTVIGLVLTTMIMIPMQSHSLFNQRSNGGGNGAHSARRHQIDDQERHRHQSSGDGGGDSASGGNQHNLQVNTSAAKKRKSKHVIVCGSITNGLYQFFEEYFHPDHGKAKTAKVLLISDDLQARLALRMVSNSLERAHFVDLTSGAAFHAPILDRARIGLAKAVYVLGRNESGESEADDRQTLLIARTIFTKLKTLHDQAEARKRLQSRPQSQSQSRSLLYQFKGDHQNQMSVHSAGGSMLFSRDPGSSGASVPLATVYVKILRQRSKRILEELIIRDEKPVLRDHFKILCVEETKMQILARSCLCPGFCAFISNLCRSTGSKLLDQARGETRSSEHVRNLSGGSVAGNEAADDADDTLEDPVTWFHEYMDGTVYEIYQVRLGKAFHGLKFCEVATILYEEVGILVMGLSMHAAGDSSASVLLNPSNFVIPDPARHRICALVIAQDTAEAELVKVDTQSLKSAKTSMAAKSFAFGLGKSKKNMPTMVGLRTNVLQPRLFERRGSRSRTARLSSVMPKLLRKRTTRNTPVSVRKRSSHSALAGSMYLSASHDSAKTNLVSMRIRSRAKKMLESSARSRPGTLASPLSIATGRTTTEAFALPSSPKAPNNDSAGILSFPDASTKVQSRQCTSSASSSFSRRPLGAIRKFSASDAEDEDLSSAADALEYAETSAGRNPFGHAENLSPQRYNLASQFLSQEDVLIRKNARKELPWLRGHVILYVDGTDCSELIRQLRKREIGVLLPVVIVCREAINHQSWTRINLFTHIYLVRGKPELSATWRRAGVRHAAHVIFAAAPFATLSPDFRGADNGMERDTRHMRGADEETLLLYNLVLRENKRIKVSCVIQNGRNVQYMHNRSASTHKSLANLDLSEEILLSSAVASGTVLCEDLFDTIMAQTNFNPHLLRVLQILLSGPEVTRNERMGVPASHFHAIRVTPDMATMTYGQVFSILCAHSVLPVYLNRGVQKSTRIGRMGNRQPYVVTNPIGPSLLFEEDTIVCLAHADPGLRESIPELGIEVEELTATTELPYILEPMSSGGLSTSTTGTSKNVEGHDRRETSEAREELESASESQRVNLRQRQADLEACRESLTKEIQGFRSLLANLRAQRAQITTEQSV